MKNQSLEFYYGWGFIIVSLIFGYCTDSSIEDYEFLIFEFFVMFLIGIFLLIEDYEQSTHNK